MSKARAAALILVLGVTLAGCGGSSKSSQPTNAQTQRIQYSSATASETTATAAATRAATGEPNGTESGGTPAPQGAQQQNGGTPAP